jgi:hypothetical protein
MAMPVGVMLAGFLGVVLGVDAVAIGDVGVMGRLVMLAVGMELGGFAMMDRGLLVMVGGVLVMLGTLMVVGHGLLLDMAWRSGKCRRDGRPRRALRNPEARERW